MLFALLAVAIATATFQESFQVRGMNRLGRNGEGAQQMSLALAQGQSRKEFEPVLTHNMSKISGTSVATSKNEKALEQENASQSPKSLEERRSELSVKQLSEIAGNRTQRREGSLNGSFSRAAPGIGLESHAGEQCDRAH